MFFKKCEHEFVYLKREKTFFHIPICGADNVFYYFICRKCKKKIVISSKEISFLVKTLNNELCEKKVLENFIDTSNTHFSYLIPCGSGFSKVSCCGSVADKVINHYKKFGIDISSIEDNYITMNHACSAECLTLDKAAFEQYMKEIKNDN